MSEWIERICKVCGATKPRSAFWEARWKCRECYSSAKRKGSPRPRGQISDRFWAKVEKTPTCWLWSGANDGRGYGVINRGSRGMGVTRAHRVSWELHYGAIPYGIFVCHRCDNPKCVNPSHLFLGTPLENTMDMDAKGRRKNEAPRGDDHPAAKINYEIAAVIRNSNEPKKIISAKYGISVSAVSKVKNGSTWR